MAFSARVLLDSISPAGVRLTTMEVRYPRFIHSEFMTHRVFCLGADTKLYFDLPSGGDGPKRYTMTTSELHEKWMSGARARPHKKRTVSAAAIESDRLYDAGEAARALGYRHYTALNTVHRQGSIPRVRGADGVNRFRGADLIAYAEGGGSHRYSLRSRLARMRLRSCDEVTRQIGHTTIAAVAFSGNQPVYRITTSDGKSIVATAEHRFLTGAGWASLREAADLSLSRNGIASWRAPVRVAVNGIDPLRDPSWLQTMRDMGNSAAMIAERIGATTDQVKYRFRRYGIRATNAREVGSFWESVSGVRVRRARQARKKRALIAHFVDVISIEYVGVRPTYDLEVTGPYHNFIADGFVVHNSRNAASSRAIPIRKMIDAVRDEPAMPVWWGRNQSGMQADEQIDHATQALAEEEWRRALDDALRHAERLSSSEINLHKQLVNRILEPFAWITVIVTATEWSNFFAQRTHEDAQPELKHIAEMMLEAYRAGRPQPLAAGEWHTPLILADEYATLPLETRLQVSVARSARVSYLSHAGTRDHAKDIELFERLLGGGANGHWSPFEHVATPLASGDAWSANFRGWEQYRKRFAQENVSALPRAGGVAAV